LAISALRAGDVEFVRVWPGWRDAESFDRIGEFFGGDKRHIPAVRGKYLDPELCNAAKRSISNIII